MNPYLPDVKEYLKREKARVRHQYRVAAMCLLAAIVIVVILMAGLLPCQSAPSRHYDRPGVLILFETN